MTDKPDAPAPLSRGRTFRDRIWQPVRNSGWLVLLAAALGGGLIGVMANPFPAWCDAPKEAHVVCAREWVSAFGGYLGGVLTLVAAWIAFGPAKRAMELQEIGILDAKAISLREILMLLDEYRVKEEIVYDILKITHSPEEINQNENYIISATESIIDMTHIQNSIITKTPFLGSDLESEIVNSINSLKYTTKYYKNIINLSRNIPLYQSLMPKEQYSLYNKKEIYRLHRNIIALSIDDIMKDISNKIDSKFNRALHLASVESRNRH